ncbi:MAG: hypothetical protein RIB93_01200 [Coleofasciculus sp. D1-CHI-01]
MTNRTVRSPVSFRSIPSCDRLFPSSQFHGAIAGSIPVNLAVVVPSP